MHMSDELSAARALLAWHLDCGVDEAIGAAPIDRYQQHSAPAPRAPAVASSPQPPPAAPAPPTRPGAPARPSPLATDEAIKIAEAAARAAHSFEALAAAVEAFDGCPLKAGARRTVFADGIPGASLLVLGEAPGRDEDLAGKPFVGRAGQLLDRMLAAIGRSRTTDALISNVVFWRPPGNRTPTPIEIALCKPFVERLIELTAPKAVFLVGAAPVQALLQLPGIMRTRGQWRQIETASGFRAHALPTFHPAFLLRQPAQKRLAWVDLLALAERLSAS